MTKTLNIMRHTIRRYFQFSMKKKFACGQFVKKLPLVKQYALCDRLAANRTLGRGHAVAAQLARAMTAQEHHILQLVQTHGAHCLDKKKKR